MQTKERDETARAAAHTLLDAKGCIAKKKDQAVKFESFKEKYGFEGPEGCWKGLAKLNIAEKGDLDVTRSFMRKLLAFEVTAFDQSQKQ